MKPLQLVDASKVDNIEEYATSMLAMTVTLKTLEAYHLTALKKGFLDDDEKECASTILWEIQRLMSLYQTQMKNVLDRSELNQELIIKMLHESYPEIQLPKKPRKRKKKE